MPPPNAVTNATTMQPIKSISFVPAEIQPEMALENVPRKSAAVVIGEAMAPSDMVGMRPPRSRSSGSGCTSMAHLARCRAPAQVARGVVARICKFWKFG